MVPIRNPSIAGLIPDSTPGTTTDFPQGSRIQQVKGVSFGFLIRLIPRDEISTPIPPNLWSGYQFVHRNVLKICQEAEPNKVKGYAPDF